MGAFIILYGVISVKIKQVWYLGEARKYNRGAVGSTLADDQTS